jgi:hypothetical protein
MNTDESAVIVSEKWSRALDCALRLANAEYAENQQPDLAWIVNEIEYFFEEIQLDFDLIEGWCQTLPYPPGHEDHGNEMNGAMLCPPSPCDILTFDEIWFQLHSYATEEEVELLDEYDDADDEEKREDLKEEIVDRWESPVHCCVRAALCMVLDDMPGVAAFTPASIKAAYPEGVPGWIDPDGKLESIPDDAVLLI